MYARQKLFSVYVKEDNLCDFLFALDKQALLKLGLCLKERICS